MPYAPKFKPLGGTSRRYLGPYRVKNGIRTNEYSRRERDNVLARAAGFDNRAQVERIRLQVRREYPDWLKRVRRHTGRAPTWEDYKAAAEVRRRRAALVDDHGEPDVPWGNDKYDPVLVGPDGPLADFLDAAGIRPKNGKPVGGS